MKIFFLEKNHPHYRHSRLPALALAICIWQAGEGGNLKEHCLIFSIRLQ